MFASYSKYLSKCFKLIISGVDHLFLIFGIPDQIDNVEKNNV